MSQSFLSQLNWRFATKKFDPSKKVTSGDLADIMEAIRKAPSPFGLQPYHIYYVSQSEKREAMKAVSYGQTQVTDASGIFVFCARTDLIDRVEQYVAAARTGDEAVDAGLRAYADSSIHSSVDSMNEDQVFAWASKQSYIALGFGLAACAELAIDSCPMEGFESRKLDEVLGLPQHMKTVAYMAVGYRLEEPQRAKVRFPESDLFTQII